MSIPCYGCIYEYEKVTIEPCYSCVLHPNHPAFKQKEPKPATNYDRVIAMTPEGLEDWFWWMLKYVQGYTDSRLALLDWLKQEAAS